MKQCINCHREIRVGHTYFPLDRLMRLDQLSGNVQTSLTTARVLTLIDLIKARAAGKTRSLARSGRTCRQTAFDLFVTMLLNLLLHNPVIKLKGYGEMYCLEQCM